MTACLWNGTRGPRTLAGRHLEDCAGECSGCQPCTEPHCQGCGIVHDEHVCPGCLADARSDLREIVRMCEGLPAEAEAKGVDSEAAVLFGPVADPEAFEHRTMSATCGRIDAGWLNVADEVLHPLWVLGWTEMIMRDVLGFAPGDQRVTVPSAAQFVDTWLASASRCDDLDWSQLRRELANCRSYIERVLHDGEQIDEGAPCMRCQRRLVRVWRDSEHTDGWRCTRCREDVSEAQYRLAVAQLHRESATWLTDRDIELRTGVKSATVRSWARGGHVAKKTDAGRTLYEVEGVLNHARTRGILSA